MPAQKQKGIMSSNDKEWIKLRKYAIKMFIELDICPESCQ